MDIEKQILENGGISVESAKSTAGLSQQFLDDNFNIYNIVVTKVVPCKIYAKTQQDAERICEELLEKGLIDFNSSHNQLIESK